jgi:leader peptidase (prepilin peptidase)/N-methyltransferase
MFELLAGSSAAFVALAVVLGLLVGSFLNVVIHRLPRMLERQWRAEAAQYAAEAPGAGPAGEPAGAAPAEARYNLVVPRSACPHCSAPITALQNIPVISWLALRGRCAACKAPISPRYPVVELLCGILSGLVAWKFGFGWNAVAALGLTWSLIALAGIDVDTQLLPDAITLPMLWAGLLASLAWPLPPGLGGVAYGAAGGTTALLPSLPVSPADAIIGAAAGYLSLWSVYHLFRLLTGKEGMGHGDFKLLAALGAWLGWRLLLPIVLGSAVVGAITGIGLIVLRGRGRSVPIPFGPFLAAAGWLAMMWGHEWVGAYLSLYTHA